MAATSCDGTLPTFGQCTPVVNKPRFDGVVDTCVGTVPVFSLDELAF
jgi:hypothetical protein